MGKVRIFVNAPGKAETYYDIKEGTQAKFKQDYAKEFSAKNNGKPSPFSFKEEPLIPKVRK